MTAEKKSKDTGIPAVDLEAISRRITQTQRALAGDIQSIRHEASAPVLKAKARTRACHRAVEFVFVEGTTPKSLRANGVLYGIRSIRPKIAISAAAVVALTAGFVILDRVLRD